MKEEKQKSQLNGNEIEEWANWLDGQPRNSQIPKDKFDTFFRLMMITNRPGFDEFDKELGEQFYAETILISRFKLFGYDISNTAAYMVCLMIEPFSPGSLVMYANYLAYKCKINHWDSIDHDKVCKQLFPMGGFNEKTLEEAWSRQKRFDLNSTGNLLDNGNAGKSLHKDW